MNRLCHRLIFNVRRRQVMAVAETARGAGGKGPDQREKKRKRSRAAVGMGLSLALGLGTAGAHAQIMADPQAPATQRPTVLGAANGVPLVHIQTPSAAGVSHNTYRQFDVSSQGVILNNSRGQALTQLGGWVQGNPWLAAGPARIIVNEVNSSHPSHLNGYVEVAGQRAQVVIANPSGIQIEGGGFINASRAVLTTGTPIVRDGTLEGYRVRRGTIGVSGAGFDASTTDYTAILARAAKINAGLWTQELQVVTGANEVSADLGNIRSESGDGVDGAPAYALDVAELGGMYAGLIRLVGTEAGVGVNLRGAVGATAGDVVIDANGWLHQQGSLQASGQVRVHVQGEMRNEGDVYAGTGLTITTPLALENQGRIHAQGDVHLTTADTLANHGELAAGGTLQAIGSELVNTDGRISASRLTLGAARLDNTQGLLAAEQGLRITAGEELRNAQGLIQSTQADLHLEAGLLDNRDNGQVHAAGALALRAHDAVLNGGLIGAQGDLILDARSLESTGLLAAGLQADGLLTGQARLQVTTTQHLQASGHHLATGHASFTGSVVDLAESHTSAWSLSLVATTGDVDTQGADVAAIDTLSVHARQGATQTLNNAGGLMSAGHLQLEAGHIDNSAGLIHAAGTVHLNAQSIDNRQGRLSAGHTLSLVDPAAATASATLTVQNTGGLLVADERVQVRAAHLGLDGQILSQKDIDLDLAGDHHLAASGRILANRHLNLTVSGELVNEGHVQAGQALGISAGRITNRGTGVIGAQDLRLQAAGDLANQGLIDGIVTDVRAQDVANTDEGRIYGDAIRLEARGDLLNEGAAVVAARESLHVGVGHTLTNRNGATLLSLGELAVGGTLNTGGKADSAAQALHNRSATIESMGDMQLSAAQLNNTNDQLEFQLIPASAKSRTDYYTSLGYIDSDEVAWTGPWAIDFLGTVLYSPARSELILKTHAFADPVYSDYYPGHEPFVAGHEAWVREGSLDSHYTVWVPETFHYDKDSPVWSVFGMDAPAWRAPGPRPQRPTGEDHFPPPPSEMQAWQAAVAVWEEQAAPWKELKGRMAAFRDTVRAQALGYDIYRSYSETSTTAEVTASQPGHILSGGDLFLQVAGTTLNQDSSIVAGGSIQAQGGNIVNQSTEVSAPTLRSGAVSNWTVIGQDCDIFGCDPVYGWRSTPYIETIGRNVPLGSVRFEQGAPPPPTSQPPDAFQTTQTLAQALAAGYPGLTPSPPPGLPPSADTHGVLVGSPNVNLPGSSLFRLHPGSTATYLVETDPRFADQRQWLSSDHMLAALSVDPASVQKRLGDGFYEQRLVREQVAQLTGQRLLGDFTSDEQQYQALMNAGVTFAQAHELRPGIALSAAQVAALTSDIVWLVERAVPLPDGSTTQALVPQLYVRPQPGDLQPTGTLIAGREVSLVLSGDLTNASGTIAGRQITRVTAENIAHLGGLIAGGQTTALLARQDIFHTGGVVSAGDTLMLDAGRNLSVQTTTAQGSGQAGAGTYASTGVDRVAALYVSQPGGRLLASAGRDLTLTAALVHSAGDAHLQAGRDLSLETVQARTDIDVTRDSRNFARVQQSQDIGTRIASEGSTTLVAGQDIHARAAQVQAQGALDLRATRDVRIESGERSLSTTNAGHARGRGFFGSGSSEVREQRSTTDAVASSLGGERVDLQSGQDTTVIGSQVIGDAGVRVDAGRDVQLLAAQTSASQGRFEEHKSSGLFAAGAGITLGSQQHSTDQLSQGTGAAASTVGAIRGDVAIAAGRAYRQTGSDVLSPGGDVSVQAQAIDITEARVAEHRRIEQKSRQSGLSIGISGGVADAAQSVARALDAIDETQNGRMKTLGIGAAALQAYSAIGQVSGALAQSASPTNAAGVSMNISVGSSQSQSSSQHHSDSARGSTLAAGGHVNLQAGGAGQDSDILIRGSEVSAGGSARLSAEGDIALIAAQNTASQSHQHRSKSGSVGVGIGASGGVSVSASASKGSGQGAGEETTHVNTRIEAGDRIQITTGQDTTLRGAVVIAPQVQASVGGHLAIESLQDHSTYQENSHHSGGSVTIGPSPSGSLNAGKTRVDSHQASVVEQTGIRAGDGGFQVEVQNHTRLQGGILASSGRAAESGRNSLITGSLESSHLLNTAHASTQSDGFSLSSDALHQGKYGVAKTAIGNTLRDADASSDASGHTRATVSGARVTITDEAAQQSRTGQTAEEAIASLHRDASTAHAAAQRQDAQAMKEQVEAERAIRQAVAALTDEAYRSRMQARPKLVKVECPGQQNCDFNPELLVSTEASKEEFARAPAESILAVNGILNDEKRGAELAFQNVVPKLNPETKELEKPRTIYLMHIAPANNMISELLGVAYEKILEIADYGLANFLGYTNAAELDAELQRSRGTTATVSLGHSRGTLVQSAAFTILANRPDESGHVYTNPNLTVRGVGGAAKAEDYTEKAAKIVGDADKLGQITYNYFSNDPVATSNLSGGNPGVWSLKDLWQVFQTTNSMHSCYGTGASGCAQVEIPMPGGPQGTPEGNAKLIQYVGGQRVERTPVAPSQGASE